MATEVKPLGVKCNIQCQYCYQNPIRDTGNLPHGYDLEKIKSAIEAEGRPFVLFGGEPLLMPKQDLAHLWSWGLTRFGHNSVQTNGVLVDDDHIGMFKQYSVGVGVSLDGPGELNDARWCGTLEKTRRSTVLAEAAILRLSQEGLIPSVIITLHRANATFEKLPALWDWVRELDRIGVRRVRLHLLEAENTEIKSKYGLSIDENIHALLGFAGLERSLTQLRFDVFADMRKLLTGRDQAVTCVWRACDPYTTEAVSGVESNGERSNCGRTNKDGIEYIKSDTPGFERYLALYHTPQEAGGCQGCRFFLMCKGQCPGTAINGDWRNRTEYCEVWKAVYATLEAEMVAAGGEPLSISSRRQDLEQQFLAAWSRNSNPSLFHFETTDAGRDSSARVSRRVDPVESHPSAAFRSDHLDFVLPDFTRVSWAHASAQLVWEARLRRIRNAWSDIEARSVQAQLREGALITVPVAAQDGERGKWETAGLATTPVGARQPPAGPDDGGPKALAQLLVARDACALGRLRSAWEAGADGDLRRLLGYPACCSAMSDDARYGQRLVDGIGVTVRRALANSRAAEAKSLRSEPWTNIFWTPLGIRAIPHFPCSFDCTASHELGLELVRLGRRLGYDEEMGWLLEILSWPLEWSALHGIAELKSPVLKFATRTDATAATLAVSWRPAAARESTPVSQPARPERPRLTSSAAYRRGITNPTIVTSALPAWYHTDNGFSSLVGMSLHQAPIVRTAERLLAAKRGNVLDLGCGNGALLHKVCLRNQGLTPFGIDAEPAWISHARALMPASAANFFVRSPSIQEHILADHRYLLAILNLARLLDAPRLKVDPFMRRLMSSAERVLVYVHEGAYTDPIQTLATRLGLRAAKLVGPRIALILSPR